MENTVKNVVKNSGNFTCNSAGWTMINLGNESEMEFLKSIETPSLGPQHRPIKHYDAMELFRGEVEKRGYVFGSEQMMVSPNLMKSVYTIDIADPTIPDLGFTLGLSNWNDKKRSATVLCGETVFVCSNQCFRAAVQQKQRHVKSADAGLTTKVNLGIDQFDVFRTNRLAEINRLKDAVLTEAQFSQVVLNMLRNPEFYPQLVGQIVQQYDAPEFDYGCDRRSAWSLFNAETHIAKSISPVKRLTMDAAMTSIIENVVGITA